MQIESAKTADPAAGANPATVTIPSDEEWVLQTITNFLATDATVINRTPILTITDGTDTTLEIYCAVQTASLNVRHSFCPQVDEVSTGNSRIYPITPLKLKPGSTFKLNYASIQGGDDATELVYTYQRRKV